MKLLVALHHVITVLVLRRLQLCGSVIQRLQPNHHILVTRMFPTIPGVGYFNPRLESAGLRGCWQRESSHDSSCTDEFANTRPQKLTPAARFTCEAALYGPT